MDDHTHEQHGGPLSPDLGHLHQETRKSMAHKTRRLGWAMAITGLVMAVEIVGGFLANSLALLSDAGHMFTHLFALGISYFAIVISSRPANMEKTFGYFRTEILAAFINGIFLVGITGWIFYEAAGRLIHPEHVKGMEMLVVAVLGLVANGASMMLLLRVSGHDINLKSAFLHVLYDTVSSVAVVGSAFVIKFTGFMQIDPLISAGIGVLILIWCIGLIRESTNILLEATPKNVDLSAVHDDVESLPHVKAIHDIHVWQITTNMHVMTAHLVLEDMSLAETDQIVGRVNELLKDRHKIGHTTLQLEVAEREGSVETAPREHSS